MSSTKIQLHYEKFNKVTKRYQTQNLKKLVFSRLFTRCNTIKNGIFRTHNPEVGGSNPSPATIKPPYFNRNAVVFLTFRTILQSRKTCFDPILTPIGAVFICVSIIFVDKTASILFLRSKKCISIARPCCRISAAGVVCYMSICTIN